jgi:hypothetical protein
MDDIAYATWMWCNVGDAPSAPADVGRKINVLLDSYGLPNEMRMHIIDHIHAQIRRVAASAFSARTPQWDACGQWAEACGKWLHTYQNEISSML